MDFDNRSPGDDARPDETPVGDGENVVNFAAVKRTRAELAAQRAEEATAKAAQKAEDARRRVEEEAAARKAAGDAMRAHIRALLGEHDLYYAGSTDCWWLWNAQDRSWQPLKERAVKMLCPGVLFDKLGWSVFRGVMEEDDRHFIRVTSSFRPQTGGTLNLMRPLFCPMADRSDHHPFFSSLMDSLSDGEPEARQHIERLILCKYLHPANYLLPALALHNEDGEAGKNLFASALLGTVFGRDMVADSLSLADLSGRFNDHLCGKAVWFIDEAVEDKADHNTVKRLLGSEYLWIEPKGVGKFQVENTAWAIIVGNSGMGSVRVTGTAVDRRTSVIRINGRLVDWVRRHHAAELPLDNDEAAKAWVRETGQHLLRDPQQVGRWLRALRNRHGDVQHVEAFHGPAYREIVEAQKPFHELLFDAVLGSDQFRYIRRPFLYEMYADMQRRYNNSSGVVKNRTFYKALDTWARRRGVPVATKQVNWGNVPSDQRVAHFVPTPTTTADVIYRVDRLPAPGVLSPNECDFRDGLYGDWRVSI